MRSSSKSCAFRARSWAPRASRQARATSGNRLSLTSAMTLRRCSIPVRPTGATTPNSARWARIALITEVCWRINKCRVRWSTRPLCCSGVLVATNRMLALLTASQIASAVYREIKLPAPVRTAFAGYSAGVDLGAAKTMTFGAALTQIVVADVSMSLDNVLAVAGAAKGQIWVLAVGLTVAVGFMALLSAYIAKLLARYHWITWIGLAIVLYVAMEMI